MRKFLAVVKREYKKIVWSKTFILSTLLAPILMLVFSFVPMLLFSIKGEAVRIAIVDDSASFSQRIRENLEPQKQLEKAKKAAEESLKNVNPSQQEQLNQTSKQLTGNFIFEELKSNGKSVDEIKNELFEQVKADKIDAFLIIPTNYDAKDSTFELFSRNSSDFVSNNALEDAINEAVRSERLIKANISEDKLKELSKKVSLSVKNIDQKGAVKEESNTKFFVAFAIAMLLYITITIYGSAIMGAVLEEKETKIAEILFSSAKPFTLMLGKLVGVGLAGLTQVGIWATSAAILIGYLWTVSGASSLGLPIPEIAPSFVIYFFMFFLIGFFSYSTIYAFVGSIVTTQQEGGQFVLPIVLVLMIGLYSVMPIVRDPNSTYSTIISFVPFVAPITMPTRILTETPPFWQIGLAVLLNLLTIFGLIWLTSRVYRIGMLMYGKRPTIPEIWRWIRTA